MLKNGDRGEDVKTLQQALSTLGFRPGAADGDFGNKTEDALILFQESAGLYADGVLGPVTQSALEEALQAHVQEHDSPGADSLVQHAERLAFVRVPADKYRDGYDRFHLRSDVAEAYLRVRQRVLEAGGRLTSSGGRRALTAPVGAGRSATSFHYTGRALDLFVGSGMESPSRDPFVVTADGDRRWRVYARAAGGEQLELEAYTYRTRSRSRSTSGKFVDLTQAFADEGFKPIRARKSYFNGGSWLGAEWWHFQYEIGLQRGKSTFGDELLRVYSPSTVADTPPWRFRDHVFGLNWG